MVLLGISDNLLKELDRLAPDDQHRVLDFARALAEAQARGTAASTLFRFVGVWDAKTADEISAAIEEGCEQVNLDEW